MTDVHGREYTGNAQAAKGKQTTIRMNNSRRDIGALSTVKVLGREELTNAEKAHDELLFLLLTCKKDLRTSPFVRDLWFPTWKDVHEPPDVVDEYYADSIISKMGLNDSQRAVVQAMVGEQPTVVTHGILGLLPIFTTDPHHGIRSSWHRKDDDNSRSIAHLGSLSFSRVDCRAF